MLVDEDTENFFTEFVTVDASWIRHYDVDPKMQNKLNKLMIRSVGSGKAMFSVLGMGFLQKGIAITGACFANLIFKLRETILAINYL